MQEKVKFIDFARPMLAPAVCRPPCRTARGYFFIDTALPGGRAIWIRSGVLAPVARRVRVSPSHAEDVTALLSPHLPVIISSRPHPDYPSPHLC